MKRISLRKANLVSDRQDTGKAVVSNAQIFQMMWPILLGSVLAGLLGNANYAIINSFSTDAIAMLASVAQFDSLVICMYSIFYTGQSIFVAPLWGAGKYREASKTLLVAIVNNIIFAVILSTLGVLVIPTAIKWLNVPEEIVGMARTYMTIIIGCSVFQAIQTTMATALRAMGKMKSATGGSLLITGITVGLNFLILILVPKEQQNIAMYAFAGIFSQAVGVVFYLLILRSDKRVVFKIPFDEFWKDYKVKTPRIAKVGFFGGMEGIVYQIAQTSVVSIIGLLGIQALTAKGYAANLITYIALPVNTVPVVASTMIGMAAGRHNVEEMQEVFKRTMKIVLLLTSAASLICLCISKPFLSIYTKDPAILKLSITIFAIDILVELVRGVTGILVISLKAVGDVRRPFILVIIGSVMNLVVSWYCGIILGWGLPGVWMGFLADLVFRGIVTMHAWNQHRIKQDYPIWK